MCVAVIERGNSESLKMCRLKNVNEIEQHQYRRINPRTLTNVQKLKHFGEETLVEDEFADDR